jgi:hypothetical protein
MTVQIAIWLTTGFQQQLLQRNAATWQHKLQLLLQLLQRLLQQ